MELKLRKGMRLLDLPHGWVVIWQQRGREWACVWSKDTSALRIQSELDRGHLDFWPWDGERIRTPKSQRCQAIRPRPLTRV